MAAPLLIALHRIGPYHHARLEAASELGRLAVLETRPASLEYPWEFAPERSYPVHRLCGASDPETDPPLPLLDRQLASLLDRLRPAVVVSVGWADRAYQRLLLAAQRRRLPLVIVADSRHEDEPRRPWKELPKRWLLRGYSSALVAGTQSRAYLERLGFPPAAIQQPWDVVDNAWFRRRAEAARQHSDPAAGQARPHLLCVSRFVAKKNHTGLLEAYGLYQRQGGTWGLRLIGSGPLEAAIRRQVAGLPQPERVRIDPFLQLEQLGPAYAAAAAFVLASHTDQWGLVVNEAMAAGLPVLVSRGCGCAADLIQHGRTGWSFDPADFAALAELFHAAEQQPAGQRRAMLAAATSRLEQFSPAAFAGHCTRLRNWPCATPAARGARPWPPPCSRADAMARARPAGGRFGRLALGLGLGLLVLAGEAVARWGLGLGTPPLYETHPTIEYRLRPNQRLRRFHNRVEINAYGMRSDPLPRRPAPGTRRVLVFGDSVVFGGSQLDQSLIATTLLLQRLSAAAAGPVEVGNVSAGSWGPGNWRAWAEAEGWLGATDLLLVISSHDARDNPVFAPLDANHPDRNPPSALAELLDRYLRPVLASRFPALATPAPPPRIAENPASPEALQRGLGDLEAFLRQALASGARVRAVQFWERSEVESGRPLPDHAAVLELLRRLQVPVVQAGPRFQRCGRESPSGIQGLFVDRIHPFTAAGQDCLAIVMLQALQQPDLVKNANLVHGRAPMKRL